MTTIKANCPTCGEVSLTPDDIELRVDLHDLTRCFYSFTCPGCYWEVRKPADPRVIRLLESGGVEPLLLPPVEERTRFGGPPITHDDLLDFHTLLQSDGWFDRLTELVP